MMSPCQRSYWIAQHKNNIVSFNLEDLLGRCNVSMYTPRTHIPLCMQKQPVSIAAIRALASVLHKNKACNSLINYCCKWMFIKLKCSSLSPFRYFDRIRQWNSMLLFVFSSIRCVHYSLKLVNKALDAVYLQNTTKQHSSPSPYYAKLCKSMKARKNIICKMYNV